MKKRARSVEIRSPSPRKERWAAIAAIAIIGLAAAITIAIQIRGPGLEDGLLPNQIAFSELPADDRRTIDALDRALIDAEGARARSGRWPPLAMPGVVMRASGDSVNYIVSSLGRSAVLVLIQEIGESTTDRAALALDERHRWLSNGAIVHRSIWTRPDYDALGGGTIERPGELGWREVRGWSHEKR